MKSHLHSDMLLSFWNDPTWLALCADWGLLRIYQNNSLLDLGHKESSDVSKSVGDPVKSAWPDGKFSAWQPNQDQRGPVGRQVDEILDVAGHRAPVEGEGEHQDGNCCHLNHHQFSNQNRESMVYRSMVHRWTVVKPNQIFKSKQRWPMARSQTKPNFHDQFSSREGLWPIIKPNFHSTCSSGVSRNERPIMPAAGKRKARFAITWKFSPKTSQQVLLNKNYVQDTKKQESKLCPPSDRLLKVKKPFAFSTGISAPSWSCNPRQRHMWIHRAP